MNIAPIPKVEELSIPERIWQAGLTLGDQVIKAVALSGAALMPGVELGKHYQTSREHMQAGLIALEAYANHAS